MITRTLMAYEFIKIMHSNAIRGNIINNLQLKNLQQE